MKFTKIKNLAKWFKCSQAINAVKKHDLDFEHGCVFDHQMRPFGYPKDGGLCVIEMQSGRKASYKAIVTKHWSGDTGQKSWRFEFQEYIE